MRIRAGMERARKKGIKKTFGAVKRRLMRQRISSVLRRQLNNADILLNDTAATYEEKLELVKEICGFTESNKAALNLSEMNSLGRGVLSYVRENGRTLGYSGLMEYCRPFAAYVSSKYIRTNKRALPELDELCALLWSIEDDASYTEFLKKLYIKKIYPEIYHEETLKPVEKKIIMMESGRSPSPSEKYIGKVMSETGEYEVKYMGLRVRQVPMAVFYENGAQMIKELATAKAMFLSTTNELLSQFDLREETKLIQLWHGVGAFKHVGYSTADNAHFGKSRKQWEEYDSFRNISAFCIASEGQRGIFRDSTHLPDEKILPVGISRTDVFFDESFREDALRRLHESIPQTEGKKLILYAPTFRGETDRAKAPDRLNIKAMAEQLSDEYVLLIKHHGLSKDIPPIPEGIEGSFAFDMNKNRVLDIDALLAAADICITDYSSVAFEYAITERPLIFFVYDLEQYIEERGLYFDFAKDAPGPLCRDTGSIIECIKSLPDSFDRDRLLAFKHQYVEACDGHATERTIALIEQ